MRLFNRNDSDLVETPGDRRELAADAGWGAVSGWSILAGTLAAYGAFAVLLAGAAALLASTDVEAEISALNWDELGYGGAAVIAVVSFLAYFFGGYTAGRMARRAGATNGLMVAVLGVLLAVGVGAMIAATTDSGTVASNLRSVGIPTTGDEWRDVGTVAGIATLAAMIVGSILGGARGDRWHTRLLRRALDPAIGTEADLRARAADDIDEADSRRTDATGRLHRASGGRATTMTRSDDVTDDDYETANTRTVNRGRGDDTA